MGTNQKFSIALRKLTAIFVAISLTLLNSLYGYAETPSGKAAVSRFPLVDEAPRQTFPKELAKVGLPEELGIIQEVYQGTSDKTVLYVQDAHTIYEAQKSIQGIIDYFQKNYGLKLVALEGGAGKLDPLLFSTHPQKDSLKKVFEEYLEKGELSGAVAAMVLSKGEADYFGIEDRGLYEQGVVAFQEAQGMKSEAEGELSRIKEKLDAAKTKVYPKKLLELDQLLREINDEKSELLPLIKKLTSFKKPEAYPHLRAVLEEIKEQGPNAKARIDKEIKQLASELRSVLRSKEVIMAFNEKCQAYETSRLSPNAFASFLLETANAAGMDVKKYDFLARASEHWPMIASMQAPVFFRELEAYTRDIKSSFFTTDDARMIDVLSHRLSLLGRLVNFELTRKDWDEFQSDPQRFRPWIFEAFLESRGREKVVMGEIKIQTFRGDPEKNFSITPHVRFYELAVAREKALLENLGKRMTKETPQALFLAGGFHAEATKEALKKGGISYLLISPRITEAPTESPYLRIMQGDLSWKNYFRVENGKVDLYETFARATTEKLAKRARLEERGYLLKAWRDEIIRSLAEEGQIRRAKEYTGFIDEVALLTISPEELSSLKAQWRGRVDRFLADLKDLAVEKRLTKENLLRLFQTPTSMPLAAVSPLIPGSKWRIESFSPGKPSLPRAGARRDLISGGNVSDAGPTNQGRRALQSNLTEAASLRKPLVSRRLSPLSTPPFLSINKNNRYVTDYDNHKAQEERRQVKPRIKNKRSESYRQQAKHRFPRILSLPQGKFNHSGKTISYMNKSQIGIYGPKRRSSAGRVASRAKVRNEIHEAPETSLSEGVDWAWTQNTREPPHSYQDRHVVKRIQIEEKFPHNRGRFLTVLDGFGGSEEVAEHVRHLLDELGIFELALARKEGDVVEAIRLSTVLKYLGGSQVSDPSEEKGIRTPDIYRIDLEPDFQIVLGSDGVTHRGPPRKAKIPLSEGARIEHQGSGTLEELYPIVDAIRKTPRRSRLAHAIIENAQGLNHDDKTVITARARASPAETGVGWFQRLTSLFTGIRRRAEVRTVYDVREKMSFDATSGIIYRQHALKQALLKADAMHFLIESDRPLQLFFLPLSTLRSFFSKQPKVQLDEARGAINIYIYRGKAMDPEGKELAVYAPEIIRQLDELLINRRPSLEGQQTFLKQIESAEVKKHEAEALKARSIQRAPAHIRSSLHREVEQASHQGRKAYYERFKQAISVPGAQIPTTSSVDMATLFGQELLSDPSMGKPVYSVLRQGTIKQIQSQSGTSVQRQVNDPRKERLVAVLFNELARKVNVASVRYLSEEEARFLQAEHVAVDPSQLHNHYVQFLVSDSNVAGVKESKDSGLLPPVSYPIEAWRRLFVFHILMRKIDPHIANVAYLGDSSLPVSIDNDMVLPEFQFLTQHPQVNESVLHDPGSFLTFLHAFSNNSLFSVLYRLTGSALFDPKARDKQLDQMVQYGLGQLAATRPDLVAIVRGPQTPEKIQIMAVMAERALQKLIEMRTEEIQTKGYGYGLIAAQLFIPSTPGQPAVFRTAVRDALVPIIQDFKTIGSTVLEEAAKRAGYTGKERELVVQMIETNLKYLGTDVEAVLRFLFGQDQDFGLIDTDLPRAEVRMERVSGENAFRVGGRTNPENPMKRLLLEESPSHRMPSRVRPQPPPPLTVNPKNRRVGTDNKYTSQHKERQGTFDVEDQSGERDRQKAKERSTGILALLRGKFKHGDKAIYNMNKSQYLIPPRRAEVRSDQSRLDKLKDWQRERFKQAMKARQKFIFKRATQFASIYGFLTLAGFAIFGGWYLGNALFISGLLHELGHWVVAKTVFKNASFNPFGMLANFYAEREFEISAQKEIKIIRGGPLANLLALAVSFPLFYFYYGFPLPYWATGFLLANLGMFIQNAFIPAGKGDAARIRQLKIALRVANEIKEKKYYPSIQPVHVVSLQFPYFDSPFLVARDGIYWLAAGAGNRAPPSQIDIDYRSRSFGIATVPFNLKGELVKTESGQKTFTYQNRPYALYRITNFPALLAENLVLVGPRAEVRSQISPSLPMWGLAASAVLSIAGYEVQWAGGSAAVSVGFFLASAGFFAIALPLSIRILRKQEAAPEALPEEAHQAALAQKANEDIILHWNHLRQSGRIIRRFLNEYHTEGDLPHGTIAELLNYWADLMRLDRKVIETHSLLDPKDVLEYLDWRQRFDEHWNGSFQRAIPILRSVLELVQPSGLFNIAFLNQVENYFQSIPQELIRIRQSTLRRLEKNRGTAARAEVRQGINLKNIAWRFARNMFVGYGAIMFYKIVLDKDPLFYSDPLEPWLSAAVAGLLINFANFFPRTFIQVARHIATWIFLSPRPGPQKKSAEERKPSNEEPNLGRWLGGLFNEGMKNVQAVSHIPEAFKEGISGQKDKGKGKARSELRTALAPESPEENFRRPERKRSKHLWLDAAAMDALLKKDIAGFLKIDPYADIAPVLLEKLIKEISELSTKGKRILVMANALHDYGYHQSSGAAHRQAGETLAKELLRDEVPLVRETVAKIVLGHSDLWLAKGKKENPLFIDEKKDNISPWIKSLITTGSLKQEEAEKFLKELKTIFIAISITDIHSSGDRHLMETSSVWWAISMKEIYDRATKIFYTAISSSRAEVREIKDGGGRFALRSSRTQTPQQLGEQFRLRLQGQPTFFNHSLLSGEKAPKPLRTTPKDLFPRPIGLPAPTLERGLRQRLQANPILADPLGSGPEIPAVDSSAVEPQIPPLRLGERIMAGKLSQEIIDKSSNQGIATRGAKVRARVVSQEVEEVAKSAVRIWQGEEEPNSFFLEELLRIAQNGTDGIALLGERLYQAVEDEMPRVILNQMGLRLAFAAEEIPSIPRPWQESFLEGRISRSVDSQQEKNFIISTESVTAESIVRFVTRAFPLFNGKVTIIYGEESEAAAIRDALRGTEFWTRVDYRRSQGDLRAALGKAYGKFRQESVVVVAPSMDFFDTAIPYHQRLVINRELLESGMRYFEEDLLHQMAVPLAGLPARLGAEELKEEVARLRIVWSDKGLEFEFKEGFIPNIARYVQYLTIQAQAEAQAKVSA